MTQFLPPQLLALFAPRDPIPYLPPVDKLPYQKKTTGYHGIADFINQFEDPADTPLPVKVETREERLLRKRKIKEETAAYHLERNLALWDPERNPCATGDPKKTLFVGRINYFTSESKLKREFERYGPIKKIVMVQTDEGKPRGYAFIEYERTHSMHDAYKHMDGKKIEGMRVVVDHERGRTIKGWRPRRLGGGLGGTRRGGPERNTKVSGRDEGGDGYYRGRGDRERGGDRDVSYRGDRDADRDADASRDRFDRHRREGSRERRRRSGSRNRDRVDRAHRRDRSERDRGERSERKRHRSRSRDRKHRDRHRDRSDRDKERSERHTVSASENSRDNQPDYPDMGDDEDLRMSRSEHDQDDRVLPSEDIKQEPEDMADLDTDMRQI